MQKRTDSIKSVPFYLSYKKTTGIAGGFYVRISLSS